MSDDYEVAYVCDRKACGDRCPSLLEKHDCCTLTTDISHAVNFALIAREPKRKYAEINDEVKAFLEDAYHGKKYHS